MRIALALAALLAAAAPATAQLTEEGRALIASGVTGQQLDEAMGDFLGSGDRAAGGIVLRVARKGHPVAIQVVASQCLQFDVCVTTRDEAHAMLAESGRTDPTSAEQLASIYEWGRYGEADKVLAARWLKHAHSLGAPNVALFLRGLPREAVEEAGAAHLIDPPAAKPTGDVPLLAFMGDADALAAPRPAVLANGYRVFADTRGSDTLDAAMSCLLVLDEEADRRASELERRAGDGTATRVTGFFAQSAHDDAVRALEMIERTGAEEGIDEPALDALLAQHHRGKAAHPDAGPAIEDCGFDLLMLRLR